MLSSDRSLHLRRLPALSAFPVALLVVALLIGALFFTGCDGTPRDAAPRGVVLISIDTLRADHLGVYGYERPTSPFLDRLAERSVVFEHAFAQLPGTLPSHMSMLTGLYPAEHGVYPPAGLLPHHIPLLPQVLRAGGFRTAGYSEGGYVDGVFGFSRGFEEWSDEVIEQADDVERQLKRGDSFLRRLHDDERFFLFLHTYAVHDPYTPPEPYASEFDAAPVDGAFAPTGPNFEKFNRGELTIDDRALQYYRNAYDASIRYVDRQLELFVEELESLGLMDDTILVITSDHGEEFMEHGKMVHTQLYPETLRVPLIIYHPRLEPRRVGRVAELVDLVPTLLDLLAFEGKKPRVSGESLVPAMRGDDRPATPPSAYAEAFESDSRTLIRRSGDGLFQYHLASPKKINAGHWLEDGMSFDFVGDHLRFGAQSYGVERQMTIEIDGEVAASYTVQPERMTAIDLELDGPVTHRDVVFRVDGCVSPRELGQSDDPRCLSIRVTELDITRAELFELLTDPLATENLATADTERVTAFHRGLEAFPRGDGARQEVELDPEQVERLKSLGYLQ